MNRDEFESDLRGEGYEVREGGMEPNVHRPAHTHDFDARVIALAMATGTALAQGGAGPPTPVTPFTMWEKEGAAGKPLTPMSELMGKAHNGEGLKSAPTPRGFAQQPAAQGAAVQN